jgi:hypothetical protein
MITESRNKVLNKYLYSLLVLSLILFYPVHRIRAAERGAVKEVTYTSEYLRDPFKSPFEIEAEAYKPESKPEVGPSPVLEPVKPIKTVLPGLDVQGIIWGAEIPRAIINDRVVTVGEVVAEAEVLDIRKEGVYILYQGGQYIVRPAIAKKNNW